MWSSVKEALNYFEQKFENNKRQNKNQSSRRASSWQQWNTDELESLLKIIRDKAEQVEGNMQFRFAGAQKFFPFDKNWMDSIPKCM